MAISSIITFIIIALVVLLVWGIFKKLFKILFYVGVIIVVLIVFNSYFIYKDVNELKENFADSSKKIILINNNQVITGFTLNHDTNYLTNQQIQDSSKYLENDEFEKLLGNSYKLLIFDVNLISNLKNDNIEIENNEISKEYSISVFKSENPLFLLIEKDIDNNDLEITKVDSENNEIVKAALFSSILQNEILNSNNPLFFFSEYKKENIIIYPETALFKTIKYIPLSFLKNTGKKIFEKTKEKAKSLVDEVKE